MGKSDKKRQREAEETPVETEDGSAQTSNPPSKKARVDSRKQLFIRSLPPTATSESLTDFFSQHYPVKYATVVLDPKTKTSRGYGFVSFADPDDAIEAREKLNNELFNGRRMKLEIAQPRHRDAAKAGPAVMSKAVEEKRKREAELQEAKRPPKLIIRNLPWSIKTSDQLAKLFQSFGKVRFADLPSDKGKLSGFGFVTLRGKKHAEKAMEAINGKVVDGRTLAVDWAVDKQTWEQSNGGAEDDEGKTKSPKAKKHKKPAEEEEEEEDDDPNMTQEDRDLANFFKNYGDNLEEEEEDEGEDDEEIDGSGAEDEDEEPEEEMDEGDESQAPDVPDDDEEEKPENRRTDNSTTLFIRNLPYTATDDTLKAHFSQFGAVRYARVVMDRATDRPAGTGFVCFFDLSESQACLKGAPRHHPQPTLAKHSVLQDETADPEGKYTLDGRILQVTQAVSKDEATRLADAGAGKRKEKDKRRLFLLSEGAIPRNSPLYNKLSPIEVRMREASAKQRKKLIESNPALHLSLTRLAIRNIPHNINSKDLKQLAREAVVGFAKDVKQGLRQPISKEENTRGGEADRDAERRRKEKGKGVVRQAKIVFETTQGAKVDERAGGGGGKSRGYGFIEYSSHRWALMGLRYLNGHALKNEAGKTQRLIVEFAIENANVVQRRRQQEQKSRVPREERGAGGGGQGKWRPKEKEAGGEFGKARERDANRGKGKDKGWKKDKDGKDGGKGMKARKEEAKVDVPPTKQGKTKADEKLAMRTKIIARKRMMRKKKTVMRAGKK
ncbi:RNA-binding domain-containing protein [Parathielavia hyrcaniae]|uniref:RNA-binding domain-containing protein n=1 Tax=Parathielavia hyrcaniae TaxID=113614 RepID=A0AAN6QAQ3_9PEZI|nr:RNA-binding domain-containing protein [Parathielavia hyrcaniae]